MDYLSEFKEELKRFRVQRSFKENIEPEEILLDAQKSPEYENQKLETPLRREVFIVFFGVILAGLLILVFQTGYLQTLKSQEYDVLAQRNSLRVYPILAPRGLIYSRDLEPMVNNLPSFNVFLSPQDLPRDREERETTIEQISYLLELAPKEINQKIINFDFKKEQRILLAHGLTPEQILTIESKVENFPALKLEKSIVREYPWAEILSHILGYTGKLSQEELELLPQYFLGERVGKSGLEAQYEVILRGQAGERQVEVDSRGRQIKELGIKEAVPGQNIVTTIDLDLQQKIFTLLSETLQKMHLTKAAALALDPRNGQVLALVSLPSFNNNFFEQNIYSDEVKNILNDPSQPLFNRVIAGQYAPGSTIKPLIGAAALQEQIVTPNTIINDPGSIVIVNQYNPNIIYTFPDWKAHGLVNIYSAIAQSCDVYFYTVGGGYGKISGLGIDKIKKYLNLFGFGQILGIDLVGEKTGLVPDQAWKSIAKEESWFIGDTYHISIGQGDLLVTPLQLAAAIGAVADEGKLFTPYLVDKIIDSDKNIIKVFEPRVIGENFIKSENLAVIKKGMRETVTSGTASWLADLPVKVAGKTGTAQVAGQERPNAWFVSFAPYENPEIVLVILVENAGEGATVAVPIAKEVFRYYFTK